MPRLLLSFALCGLLAGCGETTAPVYRVTGTVTFNDQPLTTGSVVFVPKGGGPTAQGTIGADGKYSLTTFNDGDGAVPGMHSVMVSAVKDNGPEAAATALIPDKFASEQSGLTGEVKEQAENVIDLALKGKAPAVRPATPMP